jgi:acetyl-CoA acetyltransferase
VGQIFQAGPVRREDIEAVVVGSQNPFAFNHMDNVAAKISGLLGISGAKSVLIDTASSSGASAFENAYLEVASGRYDRVLTIGIQKMTDVHTELSRRSHKPGTGGGPKKRPASERCKTPGRPAVSRETSLFRRSQSPGAPPGSGT